MNQSPVELYHQAYAHLHAGDYSAGFRLFEFRWHPDVIKSLPDPYTKHTNTPVWQGQPLFCKSVLVQMEMGYGDCIQFARFIPMLKVWGAKRVVVLQTKSLHHLLAQMDCIDHLTNDENQGESHTCDYWVGSMSLPFFALHGPAYVRALFPVGLDGVVGAKGYLDAQQSGIDQKIGVNWGASHRYLHGIKSTTAKAIEDLTGADCYSLNPEEDGNFIPLPNDGWKEDWAKTASHMKAMKAVVTVDTGTAHLAGALGVKCFVLLPDDDYVCWRWKNASWYDSITALRKHEWNKVPELIKEL